MAYFLEKAFEQYDGPYVYISHHSGFHDDAFTSDADRAVVYVFGGYEHEYNPAIMYNRAMLEGEDVIVQGIRDMSPTPYLEALALASNIHLGFLRCRHTILYLILYIFFIIVQYSP